MSTAFPTVFPLRIRRGVFPRSSLAQSPIYAGRLYSRRAVDLRARLLTVRQVNGQMVEAVVHGRTVDLSRSGAGLTVGCELPASDEVVLRLQLPNSDGPLNLRAVVVRRCGFRAGLKFVQPTAEQRLLLCRFCYS